MSYEVKRLPLGFEAPLGQTWAGFLRPGHAHGIACTACGGTGQNPELQQLQRDFYDTDGFGERWCYEYDLDKKGRQIEATRRIVGDCRRWSHQITQAEVDYLISKDRLWKGAAAEQVNRWDFLQVGHDGINQHYLIEHRATRLGIWGYCPKCRGECVTYRSAAHRRSVEGWKPRELPEGDGYALWFTVTEGSPVSPVFETPKALADWLAVNHYSDGRFASWQWLKLIEAGWCPSGISGPGGFMNGLKATMGPSEDERIEIVLDDDGYRFRRGRYRDVVRHRALGGWF
jgi:hypothetical protein